jgi:hypothetical protein
MFCAGQVMVAYLHKQDIESYSSSAFANSKWGKPLFYKMEAPRARCSLKATVLYRMG